MDYYQVLGIDKSADSETIKKAYRKMAMKYHPDRNKNNVEAENKFKDVQKAYDVLSNPEKKSNYDRYGNEEGGFDFNGFGFDFDFDTYEREEARKRNVYANWTNINDLFDSMFKTEPDLNFHVKLDMDINEFSACKGKSNSFNLTLPSGDKKSNKLIMKTINIEIPANFDLNKTIKLKNMGWKGKDKKGNVFITIQILLPKGFTLNENKKDIHTSLKLSVQDYIHGFFQMVLPNGKKVKINLPKITNSNTIKLSGMGINNGSLLIEINGIDFPDLSKLSQEDKNTLIKIFEKV